MKNYVFDKSDEDFFYAEEIINNDKNKFKNKNSKEIENNYEFQDSIMDDGIEQRKYNPLKFIEDTLNDMEKSVQDLKQVLNNTKKNIQESISNGIHREITSIMN